MDVGSLPNIALAQMPSLSTSVPSDISIALLSKQLDLSQTLGMDMVKAMEQSVNPGIGGNIDVYA
ncbi:MAG: putative motility protein [Eubacterium sp.]|nr:putative motility protein [Eubacterium sp.]MCI8917160.1 putative motility protein [Eubacterium sp.]